MYMDRSSAILERLLALHPREIDLSLERVRRLADALGNPERRLPPVIHVAGTNGKGSTTAFMRAMLEASGKRVHVYTSPHLVRFHERIRIGAAGGGQFVDDEELAEALSYVERVNDGQAITQFEITTLAAFFLFAEHQADATLLEVGLGGRLDATNIVDRPLVSVITPISIDHEKFLGDTIAAIAFEKAGILKRGTPGVIAPQVETALAVIERQAARAGAPLHIANQDWVAYAEHGRLVFQDASGLLDLPAPHLPGRHQFSNAGAAIAALRNSGIELRRYAVEKGLESVQWPARLQRLSTGALAGRAGQDVELWLDGGHNPSAGAAIAEAMADLEERVPRPLVLIVGMLNSKDPVGFLRPFAGLARLVLTVPVPSDAARDPVELAEVARRAGMVAEPVYSVEAALTLIAGARTENLPASPRVLICGSLYLAGHVLDINGTPPK
jgi:dihydrofolate synthase/folylpolyglutamate synthase